MFVLCSKNKDTDQLCSYCTADQRLYFRTGKSLVFLMIRPVRSGDNYETTPMKTIEIFKYFTI